MVKPSTGLPAFNCPHCDAYTTQTWYEVYAREIDSEKKHPFIPDWAFERHIASEARLDPTERNSLLKWINRIQKGEIFFGEKGTSDYHRQIDGLFVSECFHCKEFAVWNGPFILFPGATPAEPANVDLPEEIKLDFEEARKTVEVSPRGAAALLRLCVQKLVKHLGEKGKNIDEDIASLVKKGLDSRVQKALDIVRVIGNEAVHPGTLDLKDDRETALELFVLVNLIADEMISRPKNLDAIYQSLPESKRQAIEKRDAKS